MQRALELEEARREGSEQIRRVLLGESRFLAERLERAGHLVIYHEFLDAYPPGVRIHLCPRRGPMDLRESERSTLEFTWGDPEEGKLCVRRWTGEGLGTAVEQGAAGPDTLDAAWVQEHVLAFVRTALAGQA